MRASVYCLKHFRLYYGKQEWIEIQTKDRSLQGGKKMRIIARLPDQRQVGALVDSLKNIGFDRVEEATEAGVSMIKTERNGLNDVGTFAEGIKGLKGDKGILVAVKTPKHEVSKVREVMEQSGAVEIIQD
jgi:hypothetical protein